MSVFDEWDKQATDKMAAIDVKAGTTRVIMYKGVKVRESVAHYHTSPKGVVCKAIIWVREPFQAREIDGKRQTIISADFAYTPLTPEKQRKDFEETARRNVAKAFREYWLPGA